MRKFTPEPPPVTNDVSIVIDWAMRQFRNIEASIDQRLDLNQDHAAPDRLASGQVRYADGSDWNPGSGEGVYAYYGSAWNKL